MSDNSKNDDFLTIRLDDEDRRDYQQKKHTATSSTTSFEKAPANTQVQKRSSPFLVLLCLIIALTASGACYYLYDLSLKQTASLKSAENRIQQLENKLSATDEEMGESTIALQVKVNELAEKSSELWEQMDKLWASAWRRNQKEIADLGARVSNVQNTLQESINQVSRTAETQRTSLNSVETQVSALNDEVLALNFQLEQAIESKNNAIQSNKTLQEKLSILEQKNSDLSGRLSQMENEIKTLATKLVTQTNS